MMLNDMRLTPLATSFSVLLAGLPVIGSHHTKQRPRASGCLPGNQPINAICADGFSVRSHPYSQFIPVSLHVHLLPNLPYNLRVLCIREIYLKHLQSVVELRYF